MVVKAYGPLASLLSVDPVAPLWGWLLGEVAAAALDSVPQCDDETLEPVLQNRFF